MTTNSNVFPARVRRLWVKLKKTSVENLKMVPQKVEYVCRTGPREQWFNNLPKSRTDGVRFCLEIHLICAHLNVGHEAAEVRLDVFLISRIDEQFGEGDHEDLARRGQERLGTLENLSGNFLVRNHWPHAANVTTLTERVKQRAL